MPEFHLSIPIDHVGLVNNDLDRMELLYRRLGFHIAPRQSLHTSTHVDQAPQSVGQHSAHIILQQGYLELTAVEGTAPNMHLTPYLGRPDGVQIVAIQTDSARDAHHQMHRMDLSPSDLAISSRTITYGVGGAARFAWFMLSPSEFPEALLWIHWEGNWYNAMDPWMTLIGAAGMGASMAAVCREGQLAPSHHTFCVVS